MANIDDSSDEVGVDVYNTARSTKISSERKVSPQQQIPAGSKVMAASDRRSSLRRRRFFNNYDEGACCGTSWVTFFFRIILLLPAPLFVASMLLVSKNKQQSLAADAIRVPIQFMSVTLIIYSRTIVYISKSRLPSLKWNCFEIFEGLILLAGAMVVTTLLFGQENPTSLITSYIMSTAVYACMYIAFHPIIKQVMVAQKRKLTGFAAEIGGNIAAGCAIISVIVGYCMNVLTSSVSATETLATGTYMFADISLNPKYTCVNKTSFVAFITSFPESAEGKGCPRGSGGINPTNNSWCGFQSWEEACWRIGILPAYFTVGQDAMIIAVIICYSILLKTLLHGRGLIKSTPSGGLDKSTIAFLTRPRVVFALLCYLGVAICAVISLSEIVVNGNFVSSPTPNPVPDYPNLVLPAICYGQCSTIVVMTYYACMFLATFAWVIETMGTCKCFGYKCIDNTKSQAKLALGPETEADLLSTSQKSFLLEHMQKMTTEKKKKGDTKFLQNHELVVGSVTDTTAGLQNFLCLSDESMKFIREQPEQAIIDEVNKLDEKEIIDLLRYIREEPVSEKEYENGVRDKGRPPGTCLKDFMKDENAIRGSLSRAHVIALRLYTTSAYKFINNPLRDQNRRSENRQHPMAATVICIQEGIKKLRNVVSLNEEERRSSGGIAREETAVLWRGMKNLYVNNEFLLYGGTELAPMSTTTSFNVAVQYGTCATGSLLFKIVVPTALQHGADLRWCSAFPGEAEVLYPPLTYLKSRKRHQEIVCEENNIVVTIIEVEPDLSAL